MLRCNQPAISPFETRLLVGALSVNPVPEVGVDQGFKRALPFTTGTGEFVVIDECMEPVATAIPYVPYERTLVKQLTVLCKKAVMQPSFKTRPAEANIGKKVP